MLWNHHEISGVEETQKRDRGESERKALLHDVCARCLVERPFINLDKENKGTKLRRPRAPPTADQNSRDFDLFRLASPFTVNCSGISSHQRFK